MEGTCCKVVRSKEHGMGIMSFIVDSLSLCKVSYFEPMISSNMFNLL
jgi:hypothetical protein